MHSPIPPRFWQSSGVPALPESPLEVPISLYWPQRESKAKSILVNKWTKAHSLAMTRLVSARVKSLLSTNCIQATCWGWSLLYHITVPVLSQTVPGIYRAKAMPGTMLMT